MTESHLGVEATDRFGVEAAIEAFQCSPYSGLLLEQLAADKGCRVVGGEEAAVVGESYQVEGRYLSVGWLVYFGSSPNRSILRMRTELSDGTFTIRAYRLSDAEAVYSAALESVAEVFPWLPWCHPGYALRETEGWLEHCVHTWDIGVEFNFGIFDAATGEFLGGCGLNQIRPLNKIANLGYWVRTSAAGRGAATAATVLTSRFGLEDIGLNRIEILAAVGNHASQRVAEKSGAFREGILRKRLELHGTVHDAVIFSMVAGDKV